GFISSPIITTAPNGAASSRASRRIASFFTTTCPSAQRVVEFGQAQQVAGVVGGLADHEHRERDLVRRRDGFVVPDACAVADALDRDRRGALYQLPRPRLFFGGRPRGGRVGVGDLQALRGGVAAQVNPCLPGRQVAGDVGGQARLLGAG